MKERAPVFRFFLLLLVPLFPVLLLPYQRERICLTKCFSWDRNIVDNIADVIGSVIAIVFAIHPLFFGKWKGKKKRNLSLFSAAENVFRWQANSHTYNRAIATTTFYFPFSLSLSLSLIFVVYFPPCRRLCLLFDICKMHKST